MEKFGEAFVQYRARTPRFFPDLRLFHEPESYSTNPRLYRRTMTNGLWFAWLVGIVELVEALHEYHVLKPLIQVL
jgi:hypothetical protein